MDHHRAYFDDFFHHFECVNNAFLKTSVQPTVAPYAVVAHVVRILSTSALGIECIVEDHTGRAMFLLRGDAAFDFFSHNLRAYEPDEPILNPYALNNHWFCTCVFKITVCSPTRFIVDQLCMVRDIVDEFATVNMNDEEFIAYKQSKLSATPQIPWPGNHSSHLPSLNRQISFVTQGLTKRIYAPL